MGSERRPVVVLQANASLRSNRAQLDLCLLWPTWTSQNSTTPYFKKFYEISKSEHSPISSGPASIPRSIIVAAAASVPTSVVNLQFLKFGVLICSLLPICGRSWCFLWRGRIISFFDHWYLPNYNKYFGKCIIWNTVQHMNQKSLFSITIGGDMNKWSHIWTIMYVVKWT